MGLPTAILLVFVAVLQMSDPQLPSMIGLRLQQASTADALKLANYLMRRPFGPKRIRRECRLLSDRQMQGIFDAISAAKRDTRMKPNVLDVFASLHANPDVNTAAHGGPGFLSWHRVYMFLFEKLLRMYNPEIVLCYWDSTLEPVNMADSAMWSSKLFGQHDGSVNTGFAGGWVTPLGVLTREGGVRGRAMNPLDLFSIYSRPSLGEISFPNGEILSNLEECHNHVHVYVGGLMGQVETASYDPVFWFLHTYIDCVYEWFREIQADNGTVNRQLDWPLDYGDENSAPLRAMRFGKLKMIDGANDWFTEHVIACEKMPEKCLFDRDCGVHMRCNRLTGRCISDTVRPVDSEFLNTLLGKFGNLADSIGKVGNLGNIQKMFGGTSLTNTIPELPSNNNDQQRRQGQIGNRQRPGSFGDQDGPNRNPGRGPQNSIRNQLGGFQDRMDFHGGQDGDMPGHFQGNQQGRGGPSRFHGGQSGPFQGGPPGGQRRGPGGFQGGQRQGPGGHFGGQGGQGGFQHGPPGGRNGGQGQGHFHGGPPGGFPGHGGPHGFPGGFNGGM